MYPNLYYLVDDLFGIKLNGLKLINSFGFFVAIAFVASGYVLYLELKRKEALGEFTSKEEKIIVGAPASTADLITNFIFGYLFGYKIVGAFTIENALNNTQAFILSLQGNIGAGILVGGIMVFLKWKEKDKVKLAKPETRTVQVWPQDRVGDIVLQAALWGFLGAKIFHNLENIDELVKDPIGSLISFSGLTFYGGLIVATFAVLYYTNKNKIPTRWGGASLTQMEKTYNGFPMTVFILGGGGLAIWMVLNDKKIVDLMFWRKKPTSSTATTNKADTKAALADKNKPDAQKNNDMDDILDLTLPDD